MTKSDKSSSYYYKTPVRIHKSELKAPLAPEKKRKKKNELSKKRFDCN